MTASPSQPTSSPRDDYETISGFSLLNMLLRNRYVVGATALLLGMLVGVVLLLLPRHYTAESSFMLQTHSNLPTNLSGLASQFGLTLPTGEPNQSPAFYA